MMIGGVVVGSALGDGSLGRRARDTGQAGRLERRRGQDRPAVAATS
jgi:hypothetical protein